MIEDRYVLKVSNFVGTPYGIFEEDDQIANVRGRTKSTELVRRANAYDVLKDEVQFLRGVIDDGLPSESVFIDDDGYINFENDGNTNRVHRDDLPHLRDFLTDRMNQKALKEVGE